MLKRKDTSYIQAWFRCCGVNMSGTQALEDYHEDIGIQEAHWLD